MTHRTGYERDHKCDGCHKPVMTVCGYMGNVVSKVTAPPGTPNEHDAYLVISPATDEFAGHEDHIAYGRAEEWKFAIPCEGCTIWLMSEKVDYIYKSNVWVLYQVVAARKIVFNNVGGMIFDNTVELVVQE